jgi:hypothetical protein
MNNWQIMWQNMMKSLMMTKQCVAKQHVIEIIEDNKSRLPSFLSNSG